MNCVVLNTFTVKYILIDIQYSQYQGNTFALKPLKADKRNRK